MQRAIIHLNIADFAVAVERQCDSRLRRRPVIIAPSSPRATVYDMSDEAYRNGVRKGMPLHLATRRCREALLIPPHTERYATAARLLLRQAQPYSPLVEATDSNGHLFLDVTACGKLFGPAPDIAQRLRKSVRGILDIDPIWTVAPSKLMAKLTSRLVKPHGEYIVASGEEEKILSPCPLALLPGIETSDIARLQQFNITRIGELAALSAAQLAIAFGRRAGYLYELAHGIDRTLVLPPARKPPIIEQEHRFAGGSNDWAQVEKALFLLAEKTGCQLRRQGLATDKIALQLFYNDGVSCTRQTNLATTSADDLTIFSHIRRLLQRTWRRRIRLAGLRLVCPRLTSPPPTQLGLFAHRQPDQRTALLPALDTIRRRFGDDSVRWGKQLVSTFQRLNV